MSEENRLFRMISRKLAVSDEEQENSENFAMNMTLATATGLVFAVFPNPFRRFAAHKLESPQAPQSTPEQPTQ